MKVAIALEWDSQRQRNEKRLEELRQKIAVGRCRTNTARTVDRWGGCFREIARQDS